MDTSLVKYDAACRAIAEAKSVDEVKDLRDKAEAMRAYARQAKNRQGEIDMLEIRIRAERRLGELMRDQKETVGLNRGGRPKKTPSDSDAVLPTLAEAGIDDHLADRARKMAAVPEEKFNESLAGWRREVEASTERVTANLLQQSTPHVSHNSGENEWYTPPEYLKAARAVLGVIDLDPASTKAANGNVQAEKFYTLKDDGLTKEWAGRVWMNPPYASELIGKFTNKLTQHYLKDDISEALVLVNNATETAWFQEMAKHAAAISLVSPRIRFLSPDGTTGAPLQGQVILYFGDNKEGFQQEFERFGLVVWR